MRPRALGEVEIRRLREQAARRQKTQGCRAPPGWHTHVRDSIRREDSSRRVGRGLEPPSHVAFACVRREDNGIHDTIGNRARRIAQVRGTRTAQDCNCRCARRVKKIENRTGGITPAGRARWKSGAHEDLPAHVCHPVRMNLTTADSHTLTSSVSSLRRTGFDEKARRTRSRTARHAIAATIIQTARTSGPPE